MKVSRKIATLTHEEIMLLDKSAELVHDIAQFLYDKGEYDLILDCRAFSASYISELADLLSDLCCCELIAEPKGTYIEP